MINDSSGSSQYSTQSMRKMVQLRHPYFVTPTVPVPINYDCSYNLLKGSILLFLFQLLHLAQILFKSFAQFVNGLFAMFLGLEAIKILKFTRSPLFLGLVAQTFGLFGATFLIVLRRWIQIQGFLIVIECGRVVAVRYRDKTIFIGLMGRRLPGLTGFLLRFFPFLHDMIAFFHERMIMNGGGGSKDKGLSAGSIPLRHGSQSRQGGGRVWIFITFIVIIMFHRMLTFFGLSIRFIGQGL
mmetsp:Transcript_13092/g.27146  ORF Transcript_13092/g.27146 Transcript_13092/m.27146 type:complete len:240 (-) Transcript_13092:568-1287(-)